MSVGKCVLSPEFNCALIVAQTEGKRGGKGRRGEREGKGKEGKRGNDRGGGQREGGG